MTKIILDGRAFRDAAIFASKEEERFCLRGVCVERAPDAGHVIAVAADGHRLVAINCIGSVDPPDARPIIDLACLAAVKKARNPWLKVEDGTVTVLDLHKIKINSPADVPVGTDFAAGQFPKSLIDYTFPTWRPLLPPSIDHGGKPIAQPAFNIAYLADFAKVLPPSGEREGSPKIIRIIPTRGDRPAWVFLPERPDFIGVIMPIRTLAPVMPAWLTAGSNISAPEPEPAEPPADLTQAGAAA